MKRRTCRRCGAEVIDARDAEGKLLPYNAEPHREGYVQLREDQSWWPTPQIVAHPVSSTRGLHDLHSHHHCPLTHETIEPMRGV